MTGIGKNAVGRVLRLLALMALLGTFAGLSMGSSGLAEAQTVAVPIARHVVLDSAADYCYLTWFADADSVAPRWYSYTVPCQPPVPAGHWYTSAYNIGAQMGVAYKWGGGDFINPDLIPANGNEFFLRIGSTDDLAGDVNNNWHNCPPGQGPSRWKWTCPHARGVDCSGFVTRVWGQPVAVKWGTGQIPNHSVEIPGPTQADLQDQMRMGDVFNGPSHVVLFHYVDESILPPQPVFYEASWGQHRVIHNTQAGWGGVIGFIPYRYEHIRDDSYLPLLCQGCEDWNAYSTAFVRNNHSAVVPGNVHVVQHAVYASLGGDANALASRTLVQEQAAENDTWQVHTNDLDPGDGYSGGGVIAADTGTSTAVRLLSGGSQDRQSVMVAAAPSFSSLGLGISRTLYFANFLNGYSGAYLSEVRVQNAGNATTAVTATYYDPSGNIACTETFGDLRPWGTVAFRPWECTDPSPPGSIGGLRLSADQPLAAVAQEYRSDAQRRAGYNAFSQGFTDLYAPGLVRYLDGWQSGVHLHNVDQGDPTTVSVHYYRSDGSSICTDLVSLPLRGHYDLYLGGFGTCLWPSGETIFSAHLAADRPFVALVNQEDFDGDNEFRAYNPLPAAETRLVFPYLQRDGNQHEHDIGPTVRRCPHCTPGRPRARGMSWAASPVEVRPSGPVSHPPRAPECVVECSAPRLLSGPFRGGE